MADGNLTAQEQSDIQAAIDQYSAAGFVADDAKDFFCRNWDNIKKALQFLKGFLPPPVPSLIDAVIWIGDKAHASHKICPTG